MTSKLPQVMRRILRVLGLIALSFGLFAAFLIGKNTGGGLEPRQVLAQLPQHVEPKYGIDPERDWWKVTSVYQIYPRSFKDSDGDGIGDLNGVISKLDYIKDLGVETIWLSPFFKSPQKDHGYDISDYLGIEPAYGDMAIVDSLIAEVHRREMKIVFDLVLNHSSDEHPWFQESRSSRNNPKSDWYVWREGRENEPPNNWKNITGQGSAWTYVPERDQYYYAAFLPFQPDLNMANPEVKEEMFRIVRYWLDKGVDGFRLDIFNFIFEDSSFTDNPFTWRMLPNMAEGKWAFEEHKYNFHRPEVIEFAKELRAILESYPDGRFMVGEVFGSHLQLRELLGTERLDGLNLVFLFDFMDKFEFSSDYFRDKAIEYEAIYPNPLVPTYVFSNHDRFRSITRVQNDPRKAEVLVTFQLTMRGVPFIYQGEEIGMYTGSIPKEVAQDPLSEGWRDIPGWLEDASGVLTNRDNVRTPMQWDGSISAGFSSESKTWLPVQENFQTINVETESNDQGSLLTTYRALLQLRSTQPELVHGAVEFDDPSVVPKGIMAYSRLFGGNRVRVYLNFSDQAILLDRSASDGEGVLWSRRAEFGDNAIQLGPYGILIFEI